MSKEATVLFDIPGPRARARNMVLTAIVSVVLVAIFAALVWRLSPTLIRRPVSRSRM